jgi:hypothetical protein
MGKEEPDAGSKKIIDRLKKEIKEPKIENDRLRRDNRKLTPFYSWRGW